MDADTLIDAGLEAVANDAVEEFVRGRVEIRESFAFDYRAKANEVIGHSARVLDHGTGDGTLLASLARPTELMVATEDTPFLVPLAASALMPASSVIRTSPGTHNVLGPDRNPPTPDRRMPFRDGSFDAFLAVSASFAPSEAFRVLAAGGRLIYVGGLLAQRVGHRDLAQLLETPSAPSPGFEWEVRRALTGVGFALDEYHEVLQRKLYYDVGAIVAHRFSTYAQSKGLRVERYRARLRELHAEIEQDGPVSVGWTTVSVSATKPAAPAP